MEIRVMNDILAVFALSSAISCHLISKEHFGVTKRWFENKWFWAGLFGNLPALVAFLGHIFLSRQKSV
ncbi:MAG: hypothetical protein ACE5IW_06405 [bacterium]